MKKFRLFDEDGDEVELEEVLREEPEEAPETHDEELTSEEIEALKSLAAVAHKLIALVEASEEAPEEAPAEEPVDDECKEDEEEGIEEVIDTEEAPEKPMKKDSKSSFGSTEKKEKIEDSAEEDEISKAWQKRYGG